METVAATDWWVVGSNFGVAVGTFAAAGVALFVALREGRRQAAAERDKKLAQARLVTCVLHFPVITVTNGGSQQVLEVSIRKVFLKDNACIYGGAGNEHGPLQPGEAWSWHLPDYHRDMYQQGLDGGEEIRAAIWFTDAAGLRWQRIDNTEPVRLTAEMANAL